MADINRCIFTGRIGNDPELRTTASGVSVCSFRLAVERPKAKGAERGDTDWLDIIAWRQQAEFVSRYITKGRKIVAECECRTRVWEDKEGNKRKAVEFNLVNIVPADSKPQTQTQAPAPPTTSTAKPQSGGFASNSDFTEYDGSGDDLPF